ncbi:MAG: fibrillarin-like rRNA/tRNA 2'-O-methyltransferase [Thermoprotei archaeon]
MIKQLFDGVYVYQGEGSDMLMTLNLVPGVRVYGERLLKHDGQEFRAWDPYRSKLAAAIKKGLRELPIVKGSRVLYLGAASGTTVSHVSDIVGPSGVVYAVEFSARSIRELVMVSERRQNVIPILADARIPTEYRHYVSAVDVIYSDVAQPEQAKIVLDNTHVFLKDNGWAMVSVKARSIDVAADPHSLYSREISTMEKDGFTIVQALELEPFEKDHEFVVAKHALQRAQA